MFEMSELTGLIGSSALSMLSSLCSVGLSICTMLAIGFDCKAKNVKSKTTYMVLAFFFPIIVAIVYLCKKSKYKMEAAEQEIPDREKNAKSGKICTIIAVIMLVASLVLSVVSTASMVKSIIGSDIFSGMTDDEDFGAIHYGYDLDGETVYYDRNGKAYTNSYEVPFFEKDGTVYTYNIDDGYNEYLVNDEGLGVDYYSAFIDADGYVVFDDNGFDINDDLNYVDRDGNVYRLAWEVSWDADGNLVDSYDGTPIK